MDKLFRPAGYYILASMTGGDRREISPEFRSFIANRYGEDVLSDLTPKLPADSRPEAEAELLAMLAYRMGRIDGTRATKELPPLPTETMARRLLSFCHGLVPRDDEHLHQYQTVVRHYITGFWQGAALTLEPTLPEPDSPAPRATRKHAQKRSDVDVETELEAAVMRFVPIWEYRHIEDMPYNHIETMLARAARIARLRDEADRRATEQVLQQLAHADTYDDSAIVTAYVQFRAAMQERLATTPDVIERNHVERLLQVPIKQADVRRRIEARLRRFAPALR